MLPEPRLVEAELIAPLHQFEVSPERQDGVLADAVVWRKECAEGHACWCHLLARRSWIPLVPHDTGSCGDHPQTEPATRPNFAAQTAPTRTPCWHSLNA